MNRKQYRKRKKLRKRKIKRLMIAYLLRTIVILIPIIMMIPMVCGCLYIYERFTKEDEKINKYTDIYTDRNAGTCKDKGYHVDYLINNAGTAPVCG